MAGSLTVVGTGIRFTQITMESIAALKSADKVLFLVADPLTAAWLRKTNQSAESLHVLYEIGKERHITYDEMVDRILSEVRKNQKVCAAFYGHPGIFVTPSHEAIRIAREEGIEARMLPAVSAEDCLFADLGIDPSKEGCQSFEATDFLALGRKFDPTSTLIIWQIGCVGDLTFNPRANENGGIAVLVNKLLESYEASHPVILYQANVLPLCAPKVKRLNLSDLLTEKVNQITTLYVTPLPRRNLDSAVLERFGLVERVPH